MLSTPGYLRQAALIHPKRYHLGGARTSFAPNSRGRVVCARYSRPAQARSSGCPPFRSCLEAVEPIGEPRLAHIIALRARSPPATRQRASVGDRHPGAGRPIRGFDGSGFGSDYWALASWNVTNMRLVGTSKPP